MTKLSKIMKVLGIIVVLTVVGLLILKTFEVPAFLFYLCLVLYFGFIRIEKKTDTERGMAFFVTGNKR